MASPEMQLSDCSVRIHVKPHFANPSFRKNLTLTVSHPTHGKIASISAVHINRNVSRLRGRFLQFMDRDRQELANFSRALFDKHGFLKEYLIENPFLRGTAAWGREMDSGNLIYILMTTVTERFRGRGVGSWTLQKLFSSGHVKDHDFIVCWLAPNDIDITIQGPNREDLWTKIQEPQIRFFRKNHFRRIGRTLFFAFSPNSNHPSRSISMYADAPPLSAVWSGSGRLDTPSRDLGGDKRLILEAQRRDKDLRHLRYPLHSGIHGLRGVVIALMIQVAFNADPDSIHKQDDHGFTPVFAAASMGNLHALRKLIELGVSEDLTSRDNVDGLTPLEEFTANMIHTREFSETFLSKWDGFSREDLLCAAAMKRAVSPSRMAVTDEKYAEWRKWGCTCGSCLEGWLSPRMKLRLEYVGEMKYDSMGTLEDGIELVDGEPLPFDTLLSAPGIDFIPPHLRHQLDRTFYDGYRRAFEAVTFVSRQSIIPYPTVVKTAMVAGGFRGCDYSASRAMAFYFFKGGLPDFALDGILDAMEEQSPLGDGDFDDTFDDDLQNLPECANDLEFNLVRQNLRFELLSRGPYNLEDIEETQDCDSDEGDEENDGDMDYDEETSD